MELFANSIQVIFRDRIRADFERADASGGRRRRLNALRRLLRSGGCNVCRPETRHVDGRSKKLLLRPLGQPPMARKSRTSRDEWSKAHGRGQRMAAGSANIVMGIWPRGRGPAAAKGP